MLQVDKSSRLCIVKSILNNFKVKIISIRSLSCRDINISSRDVKFDMDMRSLSCHDVNISHRNVDLFIENNLSITS